MPAAVLVRRGDLGRRMSGREEWERGVALSLEEVKTQE